MSICKQLEPCKPVSKVLLEPPSRCTHPRVALRGAGCLELGNSLLSLEQCGRQTQPICMHAIDSRHNPVDLQSCLCHSFPTTTNCHCCCLYFLLFYFDNNHHYHSCIGNGCSCCRSCCPCKCRNQPVSGLSAYWVELLGCQVIRPAESQRDVNGYQRF